jgi:hypothetical protein
LGGLSLEQRSDFQKNRKPILTRVKPPEVAEKCEVPKKYFETYYPRRTMGVARTPRLFFRLDCYFFGGFWTGGSPRPKIQYHLPL